ncbi:MAG: hypothetical protein V7744_00565 [Pseudomonadales bacterium]
MKLLKYAAIIGLILGANAARAWEIDFCVIEAVSKNPTYHNLATTETRLICDSEGPRLRLTLPELYARGWRLIEIMDGSMVNKQYRAPVYYLERAKAIKPKTSKSR